MEDVVLRGDVDSRRDLLKAIREDGSGRLARRTREVLAGSDRSDQRVRAFSALLSPARPWDDWTEVERQYRSLTDEIPPSEPPGTSQTHGG